MYIVLVTQLNSTHFEMRRRHRRCRSVQLRFRKTMEHIMNGPYIYIERGLWSPMAIIMRLSANSNSTYFAMPS